MELLIGAGSNHMKKVAQPDNPEWNKLVTLDINPDHKVDVVWDLNKRPLPFKDNTFEEIHAYEVLEHLAPQGDYKSFFEEWTEFYRILKPDGLFCGTSPSLSSRWLWGDPGHTRVVCEESFVFLNQPEYVRQVGHSPMSDYRYLYKADFDPVHFSHNEETFIFVLKAIKPSRYTKPSRRKK